MDIKKKFGKQVKKLRLEKGLSQEKLAYEADIDRTYIQALKKAKGMCPLLSLRK